MKNNNAYNDGISILTDQLFFRKRTNDSIQIFELSQDRGNGYIYQINPTKGLFVSTGDWIINTPMECCYDINQMFIEIYLLESGNVSLIRNGIKSFFVPKGVNVYLNNINHGRICYDANTPIKYVSILLFEDYIKNYIQNDLIDSNFSFNQTFNWRFNYNTPEITLLFLQTKQKLLSFEKLQLYYKSKVGELLSIISSNYITEKKRLQTINKTIRNELERLELVKLAIDQNILNPPEITKLCQIAAMGKTKLRESFKLAFNITLGGYIRQAKINYSQILLADKNLTIQNIANTLGYASTSKFSIFFKQVYGQSPSEYRKNVLL